MGRWLVVLGLVVAVTSRAQADTRLYAFGDSYVNPAGVTRLQDKTPWLALVGQPFVDLGHAGDGVARTLAIATRAQHKVHGVAVVEVGVNDLRRNGTDPARLAAFRRDYALLLHRLDGARRIVVVPPLPLRDWGRHAPFDRGSDAALSAYREVVLELARSTPRVTVADPLPRWDLDRVLSHDRVHPNAYGRSVIADAVRKALRPGS